MVSVPGKMRLKITLIGLEGQGKLHRRTPGLPLITQRKTAKVIEMSMYLVSNFLYSKALKNKEFRLYLDELCHVPLSYSRAAIPTKKC